MKQSLQLRMSQHLALTPQLQQSIRLLQLSTVELNQELETILQANPLLERVDAGGVGADNYVPEARTDNAPAPVEAPASGEDYAPQEDFGGDEIDFSGSNRWEKSGSGSDDDDADYMFQEPETPTLREHLLAQLKLMPLSQRDQMLVA